jgi:hypothetical protein
MARRVVNRRQVERKQSRYGIIILQCVGAFLMCFFVAMRFVAMRFGPILPAGMAALMTLLITAKFKSIRQGLKRGLLLGFLAGMGIFGGFRMAIQAQRMMITTAIRAHHVAGATWQGGWGIGLSPASTPFMLFAGRAAAAGLEPPADVSQAAQEQINDLRRDSDQLAMADEQLALLDDYDRILGFVTVPPPIIGCTLVGLIAPWRASRRQRAIETLWQRELQKRS